MKQVLTILIFLFTSSIFSQDFEGVVTYNINYTVNTPELSIEELKTTMGVDVVTYFKDGAYLEKTNSTFMSYQQYTPKDTLVYFKNNIKSDTLFYYKVNTKTNATFTYQIEKETDTILGYVCDKLIINDKYGSKTYYYSNKLALNPEYYKFFLTSNKDKIVKLMQAIYLRLEMNFPAFTVDITATKVKRKKLKKSLFKLPKDQILIESDY